MIVPWWVFRGSKIFSREYVMGSKFFLVGISWVRNFFSWVFRGSKVFSWVPVGPKLLLVGTSWVQSFFLVVDFVIQRFSVVGDMDKSDKNRNIKIPLKPRIFLKLILTIFNCLY